MRSRARCFERARARRVRAVHRDRPVQSIEDVERGRVDDTESSQRVAGRARHARASRPGGWAQILAPGGRRRSGCSSTSRCKVAETDPGDAERSARRRSAPGTGAGLVEPLPARCAPGDGVAISAACQARPGRGAGKISPCPTCVWRCVSSTPSWAKSRATPSASLTAWRAWRPQGADVAAFPELAITGYPPEDLLLKPAFVAHNLAALDKVAAATSDCVALVGFVDVVGSEDLDDAVAHAAGAGAVAREAAIRGAPRRLRNAVARVCGRERVGRLPQASASQLRGVRRGTLVRARDHRYRALRDCRNACRRVDLRGPVVSRRTGAVPGDGWCPTGGEHERVALRDRPRSRSARGGAPTRGGSPVHDRLRQPGGWPGRARLRRWLVRHGRSGHRRGLGTEIHRGVAPGRHPCSRRDS